MLTFILGFLAIPIVTILLVFNIRRLVFAWTILTASKDNETKVETEGNSLPAVLMLVSCRNEEGMIHSLAQSFRQLEYPHEKLQVVLIDDGSTDETASIMREQAEQQPGWYVFSLQNSVGKAGALNAALHRFRFCEFIYIFDADHRPDSRALKHAMQRFADPQVAAVTGLTKVSNPISSASAYYATVESYINQLVTMRAKDRLNLAPALLGSNCAYRRDALAQCGGFRKGAFSEDSDLTVTFHTAGYRTRFAEDAISHQQVPQTIAGYLKQHIRWGRGLNDVAKIHSIEILQNQNLSLPLRIELLLFTSGYLDRLALIGMGVLTVFAYFNKTFFIPFFAILLFALFTPFAQIAILFVRERMNMPMWIRLPLIPLFFALDIFAASRSMLDTILNKPRVWKKTERAGIH
jgi:cellulose synthase/poly-beta-1,6-N-acetylglucosamine synthase-like glycosyltransferase